MNPLDPLELQSFNERLLDIMPQHTETNLKIPKVMYGNFPKNLNELKHERFEKTLNKYQHTIEEIFHRDNNNQYSEWFKQYTRKYFIESVSHNSFFKNTILPDLSDIRQIGRQHNNPKISFGRINGSTITLGDQTSHQTGVNGYVIASLGTGLTANAYYDQMGKDLLVAAGNYRFAVYDDSSTTPNNLMTSGSSVAAATGFPFVAITEWQNTLGAGNFWLAWQTDSSSVDSYYLASGTRYAHSVAYGAFPNPYGTLTLGPQPQTDHIKIGHS